MFKIVLAQWMNTGFIIYIIQNIHEAPTEDYITQVSLLSRRDVACVHTMRSCRVARLHLSFIWQALLRFHIVGFR